MLIGLFSSVAWKSAERERLGFIIPPRMRPLLNFSRVNEIEAMYGTSLVNVKVESRSIFT